MITIKTGDGATLEVDKSIAGMVYLFKEILEGKNAQAITGAEYSATEPIELSKVSAPELQKVFEFCKHHNYTNPQPIRRPIPSADLAAFIPDKFDIDFVQSFTFEQLFDFINICEFLNVPALKDLIFARIASEFKGIRNGENCGG